MADEITKDTGGQTVPPVSFSKEQLLKSTKYRERRDLLTALLQDEKTYTTEETDKIINDFMKGKVK